LFSLFLFVFLFPFVLFLFSPLCKHCRIQLNQEGNIPTLHGAVISVVRLLLIMMMILYYICQQYDDDCLFYHILFLFFVFSFSSVSQSNHIQIARSFILHE